MSKFSWGVQIVLLVVVAIAMTTQEIYAQSPSPTPVSGKSNGEQKPENNSTRVDNLSEEESAILPYYNNYLRDYHLGPEDVISVEVFGQPNYSKTEIVIPPNAKISYPLIPGGVFVGGKTVDEVSEIIKKKLDEYIIDPQITVSLVKVGSAKFSVLGLVAAPGVKVMNRRFTLYDALAEAGGTIKGADKGRVVLIRLDRGGGMSQKVFNVDDMIRGKSNEPIPYLVPGDQIIVPEKRWSLTKVYDAIGRVTSLALLFGVF